MSNNLRKQIHENFSLKDTDELIDIWVTNDRVEWSETTFDVLKEILEQRLGEIPPQQAPIFEHIEPENNDDYDEDLSLDEFSDPNNAPDFYEPKEVMWVSLWLKRVAVAAVVVTISASIPGIFRMQQITLSLFMGKGEGIFISWASALIVGGLTTALGCFILYFSMNALASILRVLMEMEFNSRDSS